MIKFESCKAETNQRTVSLYEMHSYFEHMPISVHLRFKERQALGIQTPWPSGWGRVGEVTLCLTNRSGHGLV